MKLYAKITNEKGKTASKGGNEYLDIDIQVGNDRFYSMTLRRTDELEGYDIEAEGSGWILTGSDDDVLMWTEDKLQSKDEDPHCKHGVNLKYDDCLNCDKGE